MGSVPIPACEVTYSHKDIETHHNQPKMFNGPDIKENLIILSRDFHAYIHHICNVKESDLVYKRLAISKQICQDPNGQAVEGQKKRLDEIDNVLMREYIQNMIINVSHKYRDKIYEITSLSQMQTIKTQAIRIKQLEDIISSQNKNGLSQR